MKPLNKKQLVQTLCRIAVDAGAAIMDIYHDPDKQKVELKDDRSPVTQADYAAEKIILKGLARAAPNIAVISEEQVASGKFPHVGERFFLVDPLDGTKEFIAHNDEFTVNIALIEDGEPVLGVVYAPALGRLFFATDTDAYESRDGAAAEKIHARNVPAEPIVVASRSHKSEKDDALTEKYRASKIMMVGSSLKFCLIAASEADIYPRTGPTMFWDTAAGHAVLRAAGGDIQTDGGKMNYRASANSSSTNAEPLRGSADCINPPFLAHGALGTNDEDGDTL